jgi:tetratricopeptide (TPR) repeat protein
MARVGAHRPEEAVAMARRWRGEAATDVMAVLALGEALEASGDRAEASRAYGSLIDLFPDRADLRRFAAVHLERLGAAYAEELAEDTLQKALADRPDHLTTYRLLAYVLVRGGQHAQAFELIEKALGTKDVRARRGVIQILREDLGLVAAAWTKAEPKRGAEIDGRLMAAGGAREAEPSVRFVLNWETDANDVDLHVYDDTGGHAFYGSRTLPSGGALYDDVTNGYGPEIFTVRNPDPQRAARYTLRAHYYARGPMGFGMGKLQIIRHDGRGGLRFEERPFVVMADHAYADLGTYAAR